MKIRRGLFVLTGIALTLAFSFFQLKNFGVDTSLDYWDDGLEGYLQASRAQADSGRPMLVFFYTDWCSSCKALREQVLTSEQVKSYLAEFHPVKINPEQNLLNQALADDYKVRGYPTVLVVQKNGDTSSISRTAGVTPAQFIEQLKPHLKLARTDMRTLPGG